MAEGAARVEALEELRLLRSRGSLVVGSAAESLHPSLRGLMVVPVPGSALVDQTLVCEAARLLQQGVGISDRHRRAERLAQLSLLLDAVVLYDHIYVLRADVPTDAHRLGLRNALFATGVMSDIDTSSQSAAVATELSAFLAETYRSPNPSDPQEMSGGMVDGMLRAALEGVPYRDSPRRFFADRIVDYVQMGEESDLNSDGQADRVLSLHAANPSRDPIAGLGGRLMELIHSGTSGGVIPSAASQLRTFVYWRLSAHIELPFYPSLGRLPEYELIADHIRSTTQETVYDKVAEAFMATVSEVYEDDRPLPVYLPPALTLFLDHLRGTNDVHAAIKRLRKESEPLRRSLLNLQEDRARATSLRELQTARARFAEISAELGSSRTPTLGSSIDQAIDMVPAITATALNPLDVTSYVGLLLGTPRDWVRDWWRRRPYRPVFQLRDRLLSVRGYADLLAEATGDEQISARDFEYLAQAYDLQQSRLRTYGPARRPGRADPTT